MDKGRTILHTFIPKYHDARPFLGHLTLCVCSDNEKEVNKNNGNYDRRRKIKEGFDSLDAAYSNFYNPSELLAIDEVIVLFRGTLHSSSLSPPPKKKNISELKFTNSVTLMATI